jgi:YtcA family
MEHANLPVTRWTQGATTAATLTLVGLSGCDPVVSVAGADFPDWLVCVIAGCLLCGASHLLFRRTGLERHLRPLPFFYGTLILMFSLIIWVTFFNHV